jgi:type IV pilus assembly protein PilM
LTSVLDPIKQLFSPPRPLWACEFTAQHIIVAGVDSSRKRIAGSVAAALPGDTLVGSLSDRNIQHSDAALDIVRNALKEVGARGFEISVVIPDDSSRIAFLTADSLTGTTQDRETFVRWKLKKTVPFDVDSAQIAYQVLGPHVGAEGKGIDIVVALSPRSIVQEYEELLERLDLHAGYVVPSTLATMNLYPSAAGFAKEDVLLVKIGPDSITTTVFQNNRPRFYRRVGRIPVYDAVYPTMMYYQDKLGGTALAGAMVCGYDKDPQAEIAELQDKLGVPVKRLEPKTVDDIYKPALGAVDLIWANLI